MIYPVGGGILHLNSPSSGKCLFGRKLREGTRKHGPPPCPLKAMNGSFYCEAHRTEVMAALMARKRDGQ